MARRGGPIAAGVLSASARRRSLPLVLLFAALGTACVVGDRSTAESGAPAVPVGAEEVAAADSTGGSPVAVDDAPPAGPGPEPVPVPGQRPSFTRPEHVRALYLNAWASGSTNRVNQLVEVARRTEVNAFVIDIKDASGYISHPSSLPVAREIGATGEIRIRDLPALLAKLAAEGIWPIARIVIVRDPILAKGRPQLAVQDVAGGPWVHDGTTWLNMADRGVWDYNLDLAEEVARMGFPEIQWDYVRFPDAPRAAMASARFSGLEGDKADAVRAFLGYADARLDSLGLDLVHTADVFGITTSTRDVGIGQIWERFIDRVDVALPMVYPSHYYRGSFGYQTPNAYPYEIVRAALEKALEKSNGVAGAGRTIPWLQDFTLGAPRYNAPEVRAQIQATYDAGIEEWVLWNPGSRYTEGALQPAAGWDEEPHIRVAGRVVPMSKRFEVLAGRGGSAAKRTPAAAAPPASPASERPRVLDPDSLRRWIDSVAPMKDTIEAR